MFGTPIEEVAVEDWLDNQASYCSRSAPYVVRGLTSTWPMVIASQHSDNAFVDYALRHYQGASVDTFSLNKEHEGRYFYDDTLQGFNFTRGREALDNVLKGFIAGFDNSKYIGSTTLQSALPGMLEDNPLPMDKYQPLVSIWIGNQSRIAAHYDAPDNLACVVAGKRRFTLFPPDQIDNLYVGPLDVTPAGQAISLVDFHNPDYQQFPKFELAQQAALVAELGPGDGIFIPGLWWHHVEGLSNFNVLVNYWWRTWPQSAGPAMDTLLHGLLNVRQLPEHQRQAWQALFQYYLFDAKGHEHIPNHAQGMLGPLDDERLRQLRAMISNKLRR